MPEKKKKRKTPSKKDGGDKMRDKINVIALIEALEQHVLGENKMTSTQVSAALALLKKTLPDLSGSSSKTQEKDETHEDALKELE